MNNNLNKVTDLLLIKFRGCSKRYMQSNASLLENCFELRNNNPRNLELMTIARKPMGYHLEMPGHEYWHKLFVRSSPKNLTLEVKHHKNGCVIAVSTNELALKKQLFQPSDTAAYSNAGRVLAQRCLESGIGYLYVDIDVENSKKLTSLVKELQEGGVVLSEPPTYIKYESWDLKRMVKPWSIEE